MRGLVRIAKTNVHLDAHEPVASLQSWIFSSKHERLKHTYITDRQHAYTQIDAQAMFDEMQQRQYVWDNFVPRIPFAAGKNYEPHKSWKDNLDATGKAQ